MARVSVRLTPRGGRDALEGWRDDVLQARVSAPPSEGRANAALIRLIAQHLGIAASRIHLTGGASGRRKRLLVEGLTQGELDRRLAKGSGP